MPKSLIPRKYHRTKKKKSQKNILRRIFEDRRDLGGGCFLKDPSPRYTHVYIPETLNKFVFIF